MITNQIDLHTQQIQQIQTYYVRYWGYKIMAYRKIFHYTIVIDRIYVNLIAGCDSEIVNS